MQFGKPTRFKRKLGSVQSRTEHERMQRLALFRRIMGQATDHATKRGLERRPVSLPKLKFLGEKPDAEG